MGRVLGLTQNSAHIPATSWASARDAAEGPIAHQDHSSILHGDIDPTLVAAGELTGGHFHIRRHVKVRVISPIYKSLGNPLYTTWQYDRYRCLQSIFIIEEVPTIPASASLDEAARSLFFDTLPPKGREILAV